MTLLQEFKAFIAKGNVVELAIAVIVGSAFGKIVTAFVDGIVMPLVTVVLPKGMAWESWMLGPLRIGKVLGASIDFVVIALVVFLVFVKLMALLQKKKEEEPAPETKDCPACLETVPKKATRCKHCTSMLEA